MPIRDLAALLLLAAVWGGSYLFIRVAVPSFGPLPLMAARVLLAAALLAVALAARRQRPRLGGLLPRLLVLGGLNAALPFTLVAAAELHLTASLAAILTATAPLFSTLLAAPLLGERVTARRALGVLLGLASVALLVGWSPLPATRAAALSVGAVLLASLCYAYAGIYTARRLAGVPTATLALGQQLGAAAWLVVPAALTAPATVPPPAALLALAALATVSTALAYLLYFRLVERIGPTRTPTVTYLIPIFGTLWGVAFLHEPLTPGMVAGLVGVLASVVVVNGGRLPWRGRVAVVRAREV